MFETKQHRILILTGHYGDGHKQAAAAIAQALYEKHPDAHVIILDPSANSNKLLDSVSRQLYIKGVQKFPVAYHYIYEKTRRPNHASALLKKFNQIGARSLLKIIRTIKPTMIISTCPIASGMIAILKKNSGLCVPSGTVITDYSAHSTWVYPYTDVYFVGSEKVRRGLQELGVADNKIVVSGIPTSPRFSKNFDRAALKRKHSISEQIPVVLMTGGGYGLFSGEASIFQSLEKLPFTIQLVIVCGRNRRLYQRLNTELKASKHKVLLTGFIDHIEELMAVADLLITKAGGMTVSEALAMKLPMLLYPTISGQEYDNTQFLVETRAALLANNVQDLQMKVMQMLKDPHLLERMRHQAAQLSQMDAAQDIIEEMKQLVADNLSLPFNQGISV